MTPATSRGIAPTLRSAAMTGAAAGAMLLAALAGSPALAGSTFAAEDLSRLVELSSPQVAPDGRRVTYVRTTTDVMADRKRREVWLAGIDDHGLVSPHLLVGAGDRPGAVAWTPDSRSVAVVAASKGRFEIRVIDAAGGAARSLAVLDSAPSDLAWSPDGRRLAFSRFVAAPGPDLSRLMTRPPGAAWAPAPRLVTDFHYRENGDHPAGQDPLLATGERRVFVLDADGGPPRELALGAGRTPAQVSRLAWTAKGQALVVASAAAFEPDLLDNDLYLLPLNGDAPRRLTHGGGANLDPVTSPDGRYVAYTRIADKPQFYSQPQVWIVPSNGGEPRRLAAGLDRPIEQPSWTADSRSLTFAYKDQGATRVAEAPVTGGAPRVLFSDISKSSSLSAGGGSIAFPAGRTDRPNALGVWRNGRMVATLDPNAQWSAALNPMRIEEIRYRSSADGHEVQGWVQFPPDFDPSKTYPMILSIHGGPNQAFGPGFSADHAVFAAHGYIVLLVNPRGSIGYGEAFADAIDGEFPAGKAPADLMSGVDEMLKRPYVDRDNLFVTGRSAGGALTAWLIGVTGRFRAAAPVVPVMDWTSEALTADGGAYMVRYWLKATPWEHPEVYWRRSPLSLVGQVTTPTMIVAGETDYRATIAQDEMYFAALKLRGVDAALLRLPEAGHDGGRPSQKALTALAIIDWFGRHRAQGAAATIPTSGH